MGAAWLVLDFASRMLADNDKIGMLTEPMTIVDMAIIAFFVFSPILRDDPSFLFVDYSVAAILAADVAARCFAARNPLKWLRQPFVLLDLVILATLLFPYTFINFGFLRIVRLWSISQSGVLWRPLRRWGSRGARGWASC